MVILFLSLLREIQIDGIIIVDTIIDMEIIGNSIFITFKRNPNRWNYYPRNRFRQFNNYRGFNSRYQRPFRPRGNRGRGRGF